MTGRATDAGMHAIGKGTSDRTGDALPLHTLGARYDKEQHEFYRDLLERALNDPDTRSIALTGAYGSGKSSILSALDQSLRWWQHPWSRRRHIVRLSLSTLDPAATPTPPTQNPAENEPSNRVQKELVKQLLYQLAPRKTPHSRFQRAARPSWVATAQAAAVGAVLVGIAWLVGALGGWQGQIDDRLTAIGWSPAVFWVMALAVVAIVVGVAWRGATGRYTLHGEVNAGALSLGLSPSSASYFDQYLDEIMYVFEVSKADVVLIEDVDRFDNAYVFDTLRALNVLVNNSRQVNRRVVFVYAIRDSVLGHLGAADDPGEQRSWVRGVDAEPAAEDAAGSAVGAARGDGVSRARGAKATGGSAELTHAGGAVAPAGRGVGAGLDRANRAKHFDVIVPIVPFLTATNARDLLMRVLEPHLAHPENGKPGISPALVRIAARHVADMRTMVTIRNEFEVHLDRLMGQVDQRYPGITHDIVLSLVLLRATTPLAYEQIRLGTSPLDRISRRSAKLVDKRLKELSERLVDLESKLGDQQSLQRRATEAGEALERSRETLLDYLQGATRVTFTQPLTDAALGDLEGWQQIADGTAQQVTLSSGSYRSRADLHLGPKALASLIGISIDLAEWQVHDQEAVRRQSQETLAEIHALRHYSWQSLLANDLLKSPATARPAAKEDAAKEGGAKPEAVTFSALLDELAPSDLAAELIAGGFLTRYFARYSSKFYGVALSVEAAEYIARSIEPGIPEIEAALTSEHIEQILREQGAQTDSADLFDDRSVYNLDIIQHLLAKRPNAAARVAHHLATRWSDLEEQFVDRMIQRRGSQAVELVKLMAHHWRDALPYVVSKVRTTDEQRRALVNAVLAEPDLPTAGEASADVAAYLSKHYMDLTSVTSPVSERAAHAVARVFTSHGGAINELSRLDVTAQSAFVAASLYPVTASNLVEVKKTLPLSLDSLARDKDAEPVLAHFLRHIDAYLDALEEMDPSVSPVSEEPELPGVLSRVVQTFDGEGAPARDGRGLQEMIGQLVGMTPAEYRVDSLKSLDGSTWEPLVRHGRVPLTFQNVESYVASVGVDDALAEVLLRHREIDTPDVIAEPKRVALASRLFAARETIPQPSDRVEIADSVLRGSFPIDQIDAKDADVVGPLLRAGLIPDESATFRSAGIWAWQDFESAVAESNDFCTFMSRDTLAVEHVAAVLKSDTIRDEVKLKVVEILPELVVGASPAESEEVASAVVAGHFNPSVSGMLALRSVGASERALLDLAMGQDGRLPPADLDRLLEALGGNYGRLAEGGAGMLHFDINDAHRWLLDHYVGITHNGMKEKETRSRGRTLVVHLMTRR